MAHYARNAGAVFDLKLHLVCPKYRCHRFRANEVRLWLSVIAYNLGNLWRRLALPKAIGNWSLTSLRRRLVKNRWPVGQACSLLLAVAGGKSPDAAAVRRHVGENRTLPLPAG